MNDTDVALSRYIQEIGRIPLLRPEEETAIALSIQRGDAAARERMIQANLRLVVAVARDYVNLGLPLSDLIAEGNIGLMHAVDRFDPEKGAKLSTYAIFWIKQTIRRALANHSKTIRLPAHVVDKLSCMRRVSSQMSNALGREPTDDELADELGIAGEKVALLKSLGLRPEPLNASVGDDEVVGFDETIPDNQAQTPFELLREKDLSDQLSRVLKTLNNRETTIIAERFGLNGTTAKPLEQVAETIGVSRERVRQLERAALAKLRHAFNKLVGSPEPEALPAA
jgi:RNA polymerase primary sigma factor